MRKWLSVKVTGMRAKVAVGRCKHAEGGRVGHYAVQRGGKTYVAGGEVGMDHRLTMKVENTRRRLFQNSQPKWPRKILHGRRAK